MGNDHIVAAACNDGYTQFRSQDRLMQWANLLQPAVRQYAGSPATLEGAAAFHGGALLRYS